MRNKRMMMMTMLGKDRARFSSQIIFSSVF